MTDFHNISTNKQQGFSLVELMVALALSLFLAAGVMKIYVNNKTSQEVQEVIGAMQDNQRSAMEFLNLDLRDAGFTDTPGLPLIDTAITADGGGANSDTIAINKRSATDCLGAATDDGIATNTYFVDANSNSLMCRGDSNNTQPIALGVENMQILYGEDTDPFRPGAIRAANKYVPANEVGNFGNVVSVRVSLLFRSDRPIVATPRNEIFNLLNAPGIEINANLADLAPDAIDRFRRQIVTTTFSFRNNS